MTQFNKKHKNLNIEVMLVSIPISFFYRYFVIPIIYNKITVKYLLK